MKTKTALADAMERIKAAADILKSVDESLFELLRSVRLDDERKPFAVFLLAGSLEAVCCVTRPSGNVGLPGGKVEPGETPTEALRREAEEEGWTLPLGANLYMVHEGEVDGQRVQWFASSHPPVRSAGLHKEAHRGIRPTTAPAYLLDSMGNPAAVEAWKTWATVRGVSLVKFPAPPPQAPTVHATWCECSACGGPRPRNPPRRCEHAGGWCRDDCDPGKCHQFR
jgi:hypothetical protein